MTKFLTKAASGQSSPSWWMSQSVNLSARAHLARTPAQGGATHLINLIHVIPPRLAQRLVSRVNLVNLTAMVKDHSVCGGGVGGGDCFTLLCFEQWLSCVEITAPGPLALNIPRKPDSQKLSVCDTLCNVGSLELTEIPRLCRS